MSDNAKAEGELLTPADVPSSVPTAGGLLRAARQAAGVHLAVLSVNLKVSVRQLEALEADEYATEQSPVFFRALASSVCRQLRVDPAPILALMPLSAHQLQVGGKLRQAYAAPADLGRVRRSSGGLPVQIWWVIGSMLVLISALIWLPGPAQWPWLQTLLAGPSAPETNPATLSPVPAAVPLGLPAGSDPALQGAVLLGLAPAAVPELLFNAQSTSWIEVRDGNTRVLWSGVLKAGETHRLQSVQALSVVVGRADAVQVSFKGQPFDLAPHTQVNVARFEVKP